jgi:uncharacterized DUF497 family protein
VDDVDALMAEYGTVEELDIDDHFRQHLAARATYQKHDVTVAEILQVHQGAPRYFSNASTGASGRRRAPVIMVGRTDDGRLLVVPVEPTGRSGVWRPITAFEGNRHHRMAYEGEQL